MKNEVKIHTVYIVDTNQKRLEIETTCKLLCRDSTSYGVEETKKKKERKIEEKKGEIKQTRQ